MVSEARSIPWSKLVFGLALLGAGLLFTFDNAGFIDAVDILRWWPVALIAVGLASIAERAWLHALIAIAAGVILLLPRLGYPSIELVRLLHLVPLVFSAVGIALLVQALRPAQKDLITARGRTVRMLALMSGNVARITSPAFLGGDAIAVMGGCEIDLRHAKIETDEAVIDVLAFWGGIEITVPEEWVVVGRVTPLLGGYEQHARSPEQPARRLVIRGMAIMGGIEVRN